MRFCFSLMFAALWLAAVVQAAPVTGWFVVNPTTGAATTKPLAGASTDSPTLGNGSEDSASIVALYADIAGARDGAPDVALMNGQKVVLTGYATMSGINSSQEQFRWGLFNESAAPFDASGWVGFIASNSAGSSGGALRAKPSEAGTFAQTGSAVNLKTAQDGDDFIDETYYFTMSVSRFNDEVSIDASLTSADDWSQVWKDVVAAPPTPHTFNFNRVGFLSGNSLDANLISFQNIDVSTQPIVALTLQVITTGPYAGAMQIRNTAGLSFDIEYYEINSDAGSLNTAGWYSLDDQEGGDPELQDWDEVPASYDSNGTLLSEFMLEPGTSMTVAPSTTLNLGNAFTVGGDEDLKFYFGLADGTLARGIVEYVASPVLAGDYNDDGMVDAADYIVWRKNAGTNKSLPNDPTGGMIGAAQYNQWRANFGQGGGNGSSSNALVPEPGVAVLLLVGLLMMSVPRRRIAS